jgi:hypothetical protein
MPAPSALLDECVDLDLVDALRARGFVVESAQLVGLRAVADDALLDYAARRGWLLLTHNERHFRTEHHHRLEQGGQHAGIICVPQRGSLERLALRAAMMLDWVGGQQHRSRLFIWGELQREMERGFVPPGYGDEDARRALGRG